MHHFLQDLCSRCGAHLTPSDAAAAAAKRAETHRTKHALLSVIIYLKHPANDGNQEKIHANETNAALTS